MITIHCSSLPRAFACPASVRPVEVEVEPIGEAAGIGRAIHAVMKAVVDGNLAKPPALAKYVEDYGVEESLLGALAWKGVKAWGRLGRYFPEPQTEVSGLWIKPVSEAADHSDFQLRGTADVVSHENGTLLVLDWKSGNVAEGWVHQLMGYATIACGAPVEQITLMAVLLGAKPPLAYTRNIDYADLAAWADRLQREVVEHIDQHAPGSHCFYCKHYLTCEARQAWLPAEVECFLPDKVRAGELDKVWLRDAWPVAKAIVNRLNLWMELVKAEVKENGAMDLGDGWQLEAVRSMRERVLASAGVVQLLLERYGEAAPLFLKASKTALKMVVTAKSKRGKGAKNFRALVDEMREMGGVEQYPYCEVKLRQTGDKPKELPDHEGDSNE